MTMARVLAIIRGVTIYETVATAQMSRRIKTRPDAVSDSSYSNMGTVTPREGYSRKFWVGCAARMSKP